MVDLSQSNVQSKLWIHAMLSQSEVNGPGRRLVIWTQGCRKACKNCFNPGTWAFQGGVAWSADDLASYVRERWKKENFEGLTLTGGDPWEQPEALRDFLVALHTSDADLAWLPRGIIGFTGYTWEEMACLKGAQGEAAREAVTLVDLLIDGRYVESLKISDRLAGSANQRFHFSSVSGRGRTRIPEAVVEVDQGVEIHPTEDEDTFEVTGFPSVDRAWLRSKGIRVE